jgi:hypothetical protein
MKILIKKLTKLTLSLMVISLVGCSNDESSNDSNIETFLSTKNANYKIIETKTRSIDNKSYEFHKIQINNKNFSYLVSENNNPKLYFEISKSKIENIDNSSKLYNLKFLEVINMYFGNQNNTNRFFGWECGSSYSIEPGSCYRNCTYYVLGVAAPTELTAYPEPVFTCNNLPGTNPKLP